MRRTWRVVVLLLLPLCATGQQSAKTEFASVIQRGINEVYNLEFEGAERDFQRLVELQPTHPAGPFFLAMVQWWKILIDIDNEQYDDQFHEALDHVIDLCDERLEKNENDVTALFFKGGAIGFQGRLQTHRSQWLAAANAGRKALPIVQQAAELDPNNYDVQLGLGIYNYYAEIVPREYPWVKPLMVFVPAGDREKGIEQLRLASEKGTYASVEATYFLMQLYYQFEKNYPAALDLARRLHERFPNNMLFHRYLGRCYVAVGDWPQVAGVFGEVSDRALRGQRGYSPSIEREAAYYLGLCEMNNRRYPDALEHFYRCDQLSRSLDTDGESGFMILANLKVGNIYDVQGKRDIAVMQYRKVLGMKDYLGSHQTAEQLLKHPFVQ
jgi:tetratricopeptide (TPR) repeat protein